MDLTLNPHLLEDKPEEFPIEFDSYEEEIAFKQQLVEWHEMYGSIYVTEVNDVPFYFRALSKKELDIAESIYSDDYERTEYICKVCVIYPLIDDYSLDIFAGVPEILCSAILEESGYTNGQKTKIAIAKWEKKMENVENQLRLVIKEAFSDIPLDEIEGWPMPKVAEYYVKAKWVLENLRGMSLVSQDEAQQ
ncbi:tail chaperonin [Priestia megaterium]|uniref:tail chaperonin n=1 Tax=Priestia megaterium TaxID=1404 RepID=UPI000BF76F9C|nr:tail chaperonin [Priestia megaterium]PFK99995.1 tail chaperonin [Priestia megaterium]